MTGRPTLNGKMAFDTAPHAYASRYAEIAEPFLTVYLLST